MPDGCGCLTFNSLQIRFDFSGAVLCITRGGMFRLCSSPARIGPSMALTCDAAQRSHWHLHPCRSQAERTALCSVSKGLGTPKMAFGPSLLILIAIPVILVEQQPWQTFDI